MITSLFLFMSQLCYYDYLHRPDSLKTLQLDLTVCVSSKTRNWSNEWEEPPRATIHLFSDTVWRLHRLELHFRKVFHENTNTWVMRFILRLVHLVSYSGRSCSCCCSSSKSTRSHSYSRRACRLFQNSKNSVTAERTTPEVFYQEIKLV